MINVEDDAETVLRLVGHTGIITAVAVATDDAFVASGAEDCHVKIWSQEAGLVVTDYKVCKYYKFQNLRGGLNSRSIRKPKAQSVKKLNGLDFEFFIKYQK